MAFGAGAYRYALSPPGAQEFATGITMFWALFNIFILLACLGALLERRQMRAWARMACSIPANMFLGERQFPVEIRDMSNGGFSLAIDAAYEPMLRPEHRITLEPDITHNIDPGVFNMEIRNLRYRDRTLMLGCVFKHEGIDELKRKIAFVNGSSQRWVEFLASRRGGKGVGGSAAYLLSAGVRYTIEHLGLLLLGSMRKERSNRTIGGSSSSIS